MHDRQDLKYSTMGARLDARQDAMLPPDVATGQENSAADFGRSLYPLILIIIIISVAVGCSCGLVLRAGEEQYISLPIPKSWQSPPSS